MWPLVCCELFWLGQGEKVKAGLKCQQPSDETRASADLGQPPGGGSL